MKIVRILAAILGLGACWSGKAAERDLVLGVNDLGFEVLRRVVAQGPKENVLISPVSLGLSLALLEQGADAEADRELKKVLGAVGLGREEIRSGAKKLRELLGDQAVVAQSVWVDDELEAGAPFLSVAQNDFGSEVRRENFGAAGIGALANAWVSEKTRGLISTVDFPSGTKRALVSLNAVYFLGEWNIPFDVARTRPGLFKGAKESPAMFMHEEDERSYKRWGGMQHVVLGYSGGDYCMDLFLPGRIGGVRGALKALNAKRLEKEAAEMDEPMVKIALPKFEMENDLDLSETLRRMGLNRAFSEGSFPGIADGLYLEGVKQKAVLKVDEEKTEGAALTTTMILTIGVEEVNPKAVTVVFDRPFVYAVRNVASGAILFLGVAQQVGMTRQ